MQVNVSFVMTCEGIILKNVMCNDILKGSEITKLWDIWIGILNSNLNWNLKFSRPNYQVHILKVCICIYMSTVKKEVFSTKI